MKGLNLRTTSGSLRAALCFPKWEARQSNHQNHGDDHLAAPLAIAISRFVIVVTFIFCISILVV